MMEQVLRIFLSLSVWLRGVTPGVAEKVCHIWPLTAWIRSQDLST